MKLVVVSATTNYDRAKPCIDSWGDVQKVIVSNGSQEGPVGYDAHSDVCVVQGYLGTVPAFRLGVDYALEHSDADILACLHDDLELLDPDWAEKVVRLFERHPACGLAGFGGAIGLGADSIYKSPYDPMQLARIGFRSNLVDAEVHGVRSLLSERVACLDGFSQIGRREFFQGLKAHYPGNIITGIDAMQGFRPWTYFEEHGIYHHLYDSLLGAYAKRLGWETWYLPVRARHLGGQTAVGDQGYQAWAKTQIPDGDQGFWQQSHARGYQLFKDVLPIRL